MSGCPCLSCCPRDPDKWQKTKQKNKKTIAVLNLNERIYLLYLADLWGKHKCPDQMLHRCRMGQCADVVLLNLLKYSQSPPKSTKVERKFHGYNNQIFVVIQFCLHQTGGWTDMGWNTALLKMCIHYFLRSHKTAAHVVSLTILSSGEWCKVPNVTMTWIMSAFQPCRFQLVPITVSDTLFCSSAYTVWTPSSRYLFYIIIKIWTDWQRNSWCFCQSLLIKTYSNEWRNGRAVQSLAPAAVQYLAVRITSRVNIKWSSNEGCIR